MNYLGSGLTPEQQEEYNRVTATLTPEQIERGQVLSKMFGISLANAGKVIAQPGSILKTGRLPTLTEMIERDIATVNAHSAYDRSSVTPVTAPKKTLPVGLILGAGALGLFLFMNR